MSYILFNSKFFLCSSYLSDHQLHPHPQLHEAQIFSWVLMFKDFISLPLSSSFGRVCFIHCSHFKFCQLQEAVAQQLILISSCYMSTFINFTCWNACLQLWSVRLLPTMISKDQISFLSGNYMWLYIQAIPSIYTIKTWNWKFSSCFPDNADLFFF